MKQLIAFYFILTNLMAIALADTTCNVQEPFENFISLNASINKVLTSTKAKDGYFQTSYGLKIEEDCKERIPVAKLEKFYRNTMAEGMSCLKGLSQFGNEGEKNIACFQDLFKNKANSPKILCGRWPFDQNITAVASMPGSSRRHPYLWLSPKISKLIDTDESELKATIFHEMLHNCGYAHSEGVEVTYACEECCFIQGIPSDSRKAACRICGGKYQDENDASYAKDLLEFSARYKNLGADMVLRMLDVAFKNKNAETISVLVATTELKDEAKKELEALILQSDRTNSADNFKRFLQKNPLGKDSRLESALNRYFLKSL